ncbi:MAG: tRNA lysidine(34) synthetase TilS [Woeseiaceae bacterium]
MTLSHASLLQQLAALSEDASPAERYVVAFSGGLDSTVLLHALAAQSDVPVLAVHIDHGLQDGSNEWALQCAPIAAAFNVVFRSARVSIQDASAQGLEAAARDARYAEFATLMNPGDWLLSAHHQDDQAETLLLNLFRGGGPAGLAGIAAIKPFGCGFLARPLLQFSRSQLRDYANLHDLHWLEDPSNEDSRFDRNFLRHEILPRIESRWPGVAKRLQRSSGLAGAAALLLNDLAAIDVATLGERCDRLDIDALCALPSDRQRNALRFAIRELGMPTPSAALVERVLDEVVLAREDAEPVVRWPGVEVRRYRKALYLLAADVSAAPADPGAVGASDHLQLEHGLGVLRLESNAAEGLSDDLIQRGLELRFRQGGEKFQPIGQVHTKKLKKLLQEAGVVPWMRDRIPLVFSGGKLVAVADLWLAAGAASKPGVAIRWENRPPIH